MMFENKLAQFIVRNPSRLRLLYIKFPTSLGKCVGPRSCSRPLTSPCLIPVTRTRCARNKTSFIPDALWCVERWDAWVAWRSLDNKKPMRCHGPKLDYPLVVTNSLRLNMAIKSWVFPSKVLIFHICASLPEGTYTYLRIVRLLPSYL